MHFLGQYLNSIWLLAAMFNFLLSLLLQTHNRCRHETKCNVLDCAYSCVLKKKMTPTHARGLPF